jgi:predicted CXXCH cytochrome family protein
MPTCILADGSRVPVAESMRLCSQCHGPQARDYAAGAHVGMTGSWDLSRGPRQRHACTVCHDPHAPRYPALLPAPGPQDRFRVSHAHEEHGHE